MLYFKKCVEYVRYWRKYKNLKEGGPGRVQTATSCGNTPMGGPITGARLNNQRFSTSSVGIHGPQGWSELVRDFQNFQRSCSGPFREFAKFFGPGPIGFGPWIPDQVTKIMKFQNLEFIDRPEINANEKKTRCI